LFYIEIVLYIELVILYRNTSLKLYSFYIEELGFFWFISYNRHNVIEDNRSVLDGRTNLGYNTRERLSCPLVKGGFLVLDNKRIKTMRERLGKASELVNNDQYLPRARRVQMDCTAEEFEGICNLAKQANNPQHYFMKLISKGQIERTLDYVRRIFKRSLSAMLYLKREIKSNSKQWYEWVADQLTAGHYSMSDLVAMCNVASRKRNPDRYLVGILKKGFNRQEVQL